MLVGNYSFPLYRLSTLLKAVRVLYDKFGDKIISTDHIGQALGHKPKSGTLNQKIADLNSYGLLEGSRGSYKVTEIGVKATYGNKSEMDWASDEAIRRIDLWRVIYEKCGSDPDPETFWIDLSDIAGITRADSQKRADSVRKAYLEDIVYLSKNEKLSIEKESQGSEMYTEKPFRTPTTTSEVQTKPVTKDSTVVIQFPQFGEFSIVIRDKKSLNTVRNILDALEVFLDEDYVNPEKEQE